MTEAQMTEPKMSNDELLQSVKEAVRLLKEKTHIQSMDSVLRGAWNILALFDERENLDDTTGGEIEQIRQALDEAKKRFPELKTK